MQELNTAATNCSTQNCVHTDKCSCLYSQVSFVDEHKNIPAGDYNIRFFDEEGYADLRKAQRSGGDDVKNVKSIFSINVHHKVRLVSDDFVKEVRKFRQVVKCLLKNKIRFLG